MTSRSAMSRKVQRFRPRGGSPFAPSMMWAAAWSSNLYAPCGRGRGCKAAATPSSTNRWRTRATVRRPTPKVSAICWSVRRNPSTSWSAYRRTRAWFSLRAAAFPDTSIFRNHARSSSARVTLYVLWPGMADLLQGHSTFLNHQKDSYSRHTSQSKSDRALVRTLIGSRALAAYGDVDGPSAANNRPWSRKYTAKLLRRSDASANAHGCAGTRSGRLGGAGSVG